MVTIYYYGALTVQVHPEDAEALLDGRGACGMPLEFPELPEDPEKAVSIANQVHKWLGNDQPKYTEKKQLCLTKSFWQQF